MRQRKALGRIATGKGEANADLMLEVAQFFFGMRAVGQSSGLRTRPRSSTIADVDFKGWCADGASAAGDSLIGACRRHQRILLPFLREG